MPPSEIDRAWLRGPAAEVAPTLLGCVVASAGPEGLVRVRITEVEAYGGSDDPASHAYTGLSTRNAVMFGEAGHAYVYLSHGIHWCLNVVTGQPGDASGVLIRAGEIIEGRSLAEARRGRQVAQHDLARGPGCLGRALGITSGVGGTDLLGSGALSLRRGEATGEVATGPRVGVSRAADVGWRWWVLGDPSVSAYRRSPRAEPLGASTR